MGRTVFRRIEIFALMLAWKKYYCPVTPQGDVDIAAGLPHMLG
jgi:hypothetical protein